MCHPKAILLPEKDSLIKANNHLNPEIFDRPCHGCWAAQLAAFELVHGRWQEAVTKSFSVSRGQGLNSAFIPYELLQNTSLTMNLPQTNLGRFGKQIMVFLPGINGRKFNIYHVKAPCQAYINPLNILWIKKCFLLSWVQDKSATCLLMAMPLMRTNRLHLARKALKNSLLLGFPHTINKLWVGPL